MIETLANWTTFLTPLLLLGASIVGFLWWIWKRRKPTNKVDQFHAFLLEEDKRLAPSKQQTKDLLNDESQADMRKVVALLIDISVNLHSTRKILATHSLQTHPLPSELPKWLRKIMRVRAKGARAKTP